MRNKFDMQLDRLNSELIEMGSLIEIAIQMAIGALIEQDKERAEKTVKFDDEIDHQEREIENLCMKLLLLQQPVAKDLRLVSAALKMITDMERIGDQAADIAEIALSLADTPYIKELEHIPAMAKEATTMVTNSVDAFVRKDLKLASDVIEHDDIIDDLFLCIKEELIALIHKNVENGEQAADLLMIAKYFERIGDHAVNIAEWVIYSITGKHVKEERISVEQYISKKHF